MQYNNASQNSEARPADGIEVLPRIHERHPHIHEEDVRIAWDSAILSAPRLGKDREEHIVLGFDGKGRLIEMAAVRWAVGRWTIFHATTPPSEKTFAELGIEG